jgi:gluconokinase
MNSLPRSIRDEVSGMRYFGRMLDKIRLHAEGRLHADYHENLGSGGDGWTCDFLRVKYEDVKKRTLEGGADEEILAWCFENGRALNEGDLRVWNNYIGKVGWNDFATPYLNKIKQECGIADRDDIQTMLDLFDLDEGRRK